LAHRLVRAGHRLLRVPGLIVEHKEDKSFGEALRWRFANGFDAATHPRELGVIRFADVVWMGWVGAWVIGIVGSMTIAPPALGLGLAASAAVGIFHATSRFRPQPIGRFLLACVVDIPLMNAYMLGRTLGIPLMVTGRK
jgi:hypothetical protein